MNDHNERACRKCGSLQHHEDVCPKPPTPSVGSDEIGETDLASAKVKVGYALGCGSFSYSMGKDIGILLKHIKNAEKELTTLKSNLDEARRDGERLTKLFLKYARVVDALLEHCEINECEKCATIICPFNEPLHFHHDGCPACETAPKDTSTWLTEANAVIKSLSSTSTT